MPRAAPLRPDDPAAVGPYRIIGRLGEGGQGVVYLAQAGDGTPVAVKVLQDGLAGDGRFAKEIAAARRVEPFCIAQVLDASLGGRPYIVTEYVDGPSLHQAGRHTGADLQRLAVATATALAAIHRAGVVHRDFKPANVLLGHDGPRVIDFGIARATDASLTVTSSIVGTPAYMSPEQLAGAALGPAVDVFAWGSVMVFASTGTPPFGNDSLPAVISRILNGEPYLGDLPEPLRAIVYACLAKDPARRPAMQDVLLRLIGGPAAPLPAGAADGTVSGRRGRAPGPGHGGAVPGRKRRNLLLAGAAAAVSVAALASAVFWLPPMVAGAEPDDLAAGPPSRTVAGGTPTGTKKATPGTSPAPKRSAKPTPTRTPTTTRTSAPPTTATTEAGTSKPATTKARPTVTKASGGRITSATLTVHRPKKASGCYPRLNEVYAMIAGTEGAKATYRWIVNGQDQGRSTTYLSTEKRMLQNSYGTLDKPGGNTVILRFESPQRVERKVTFTICDDYY
ncbi:serine/threonine-protein kinase [Nonomuraea sp. LPB2021202275-12-8]|uniref:serine/threonine-protein kinase n=1 Tax=Nonomuraea sp. LPB2021202275-12-8 TaxID=3120159 RepID=UPI00300C85D3